jgi:hypothetical protein
MRSRAALLAVVPVFSVAGCGVSHAGHGASRPTLQPHPGTGSPTGFHLVQTPPSHPPVATSRSVKGKLLFDQWLVGGRVQVLHPTEGAAPTVAFSGRPSFQILSAAAPDSISIRVLQGRLLGSAQPGPQLFELDCASGEAKRASPGSCSFATGNGSTTVTASLSRPLGQPSTVVLQGRWVIPIRQQEQARVNLPAETASWVWSEDGHRRGGIGSARQREQSGRGLVRAGRVPPRGAAQADR